MSDLERTLRRARGIATIENDLRQRTCLLTNPSLRSNTLEHELRRQKMPRQPSESDVAFKIRTGRTGHDEEQYARTFEWLRQRIG